MPQSVGIICSSTWDLPSLRRFLISNLPSGKVSFGDRDDARQINGRDTASWAIVEDSRGLPAAEEYAANDDLEPAFRAFARGSQVLVLTFRGLELAHLVLDAISRRAIGDGEQAWFDSEYGWVMSASDYLWKTEAEPGWDWRTLVRPSLPRGT